jgi:Signal peptidase, peptidase S26
MNQRDSRHKIPVWAALLTLIAIWGLFFFGRFSGGIEVNYLNGQVSHLLFEKDLIVSKKENSLKKSDFVTYKLTSQQSTIVRTKQDIDSPYVGRISGSPGDTVQYLDQVIKINEEKFTLYPQDNPSRSNQPTIIPKNYYYVALDITDDQIKFSEFPVFDSRNSGLLHSSQIRKVFSAFRSREFPKDLHAIVSGFFIILFLIIFPIYIKNLCGGILIWAVIGISYLFLILLYWGSIHQDTPILFGLIRPLIVMHYYYVSGLMGLFGEIFFPVFDRGLILISSGLTGLATIKILIRSRLST